MHRPILAVLHSIFLEIVSSRTSPVWVSIDVLVYYIILLYNLYRNAGKSDHMTCQWCRTSALVIFDELQQVYFQLQLQLEHQVLNLLPLLSFSHTLYK